LYVSETCMWHPPSWARSYNSEVNSAYDAGVIFNIDIKPDMARTDSFASYSMQVCHSLIMTASKNLDN